VSALAGFDQITSIAAYMNALFGFNVAMHAPKATVSERDFPMLLRGFFWFSHNPLFQDVYDAARAMMPVFGAYIVLAAKRGESDFGSKRAADLLADYLDDGALSLRPNEDSCDVVKSPCYAIESALDAVADLMSIGGEIIELEAKLAEGASEGLAKILALPPKGRVSVLKERMLEVAGSKNAVYNIVRVAGIRMLPAIEAHLGSLHPRDQDYVLHGLDAFPKSKRVLAFYDRFLERNRDEYLAERVKKYRARVSKGIRTTGWET